MLIDAINVIIPPDLSQYIEFILIDRISKTTGDHPYIVLPQPSLVLGFQYKGHLNKFNNSNYEKLKTNGLSGLQTSYRVFKGEPDTKNIIIKFHPWGAMAFFSVPLHQFTNKALSLDDLVQQQIINTLEDQLLFATTYEEIIDYIFAFLRYLLKVRILKHNPLQLKEIINLIQKNQPLNNIQKAIGFSERKLERYCKEVIGLTPKTLSRLIRFHKISNLLQRNIPITTILENFPYYDQAHFINEFKSFAGVAPGQFIQSSTNTLSDFYNTLP